ncbi:MULTISPECIES: amidohydrolase family protein [unclassified Streptomyces]|uniref:amidohydrolase family protein n=1 Tax=unclassified Streptomyces TaxID=2593676 RepID=UPI0024433523|nr:amidohydrolase family protein [Streptomyces sp. DH41]MDG9722043.1 amidohydrolase family protein [Streptomyces sp. DH41]
MSADRLLLHDVTVQEGRGRASLPARSVLLAGDRVEAVVPAAEAPAEGDFRRWNLAGATVMPGMTLGHTHIAYVNVTNGRETLFKYRVPEVALHAARHAADLLARGYTAFVGAGSVAGIDMALKNTIEAGVIPGPRVTPCSRDLMVSGPPDRRSPELKKRMPRELMPVVDVLGDLVKYTEEEIDEGAEIIKVFSSGDDTFPNARSEELLFSREELSQVVRTAHGRGARVRAHSRGLDGIRNALAAGVDVIDHATYADDEALETIAERGVFVVPSLFQPDRLLALGEKFGKAPDYLESLDFRKEIENTLRFLPMAEKLGLKIVPGDDFGFAWTPHGTYADELVMYVERAGIAPETVLKWACAHGAELAGRGRDAGEVAPGRLADLVVWDRDPAADLRVLQDRGALRSVLIGGRHVAGPLAPPAG